MRLQTLYKLTVCAISLCLAGATALAQEKTDPVADNMLLYQRAIGGWPKALGNVKVDYHKTLNIPDRQATIEDAYRNDATIDNDATYKEINYLIEAYHKTENKAYLKAAEKGVRYLLKAQQPNGGWPQFYPDTSAYRKDITYNDGAMIKAITVLNNVAKKQNGFEVVDPSLCQPSAKAVDRGVQCILKTQIKVDGKLTAWAQQYDPVTLQPAPARKFELIGLSGAESVGIVKFLMQVDHPSPPIKAAVRSAMEWFDKVKIKGYRFERVADASSPNGHDGVLVPDANATVWARYYEIGTNRPFFSGRNSVKVYDLKQIEVERRGGYAWYGTWPQELLTTAYPEWAGKNGLKK